MDSGVRRTWQFSHEPSAGILVAMLGVGIVGGVIATLVAGDPRLLTLPFGLLLILLILVDYKRLYLLLWASIPISTELEFGSVGADLPDEALMIVLLGVAIILFAVKGPRLSYRMLYNPVTLLLILHFLWIGITAVNSTEPIISLKFLAAKLWYIAVFFFLTYYLIRDEADVRQWLRWLLIPVLLTIMWVWIRHAGDGFSFESVNEYMKPFYRNHVDYALMLGVVLPFAWVFRSYWRGKYTGWIICIVLALGIYFAYTRAAYLGVIAGAIGVLLIQTRTLKYALLAATIFVGVLVSYLSQENRYIDYAPDFHKTITHYEFDNLLEATYKFEDISTMERVYRWIAGFYMIREKPLMGFGPGSFYESYRPYTDEHFITYVSDNPEKSGIHNYFLMTATDQGLVGLAIFLMLLIAVLLKAQWLYRRLENGFPKDLLVACIATLFFIIFVLTLNDMIETDKVGSFFFFSVALIVTLEERYASRTAPDSRPSRPS